MMYNNFKSLILLLKNRNLSAHKIEEKNRYDLEQILKSAFDNVPYYNFIMKKIQYNPHHDFSGVADLKLLPILKKNDLKNNNIQDFLNKNEPKKNIFKDATSGSSGIPIAIYRNEKERSLQIAKWLRVLIVNGYRFHHKVMSCTSPARLNEGKSFLQNLGLFRRLTIDYLSSSDVMVNEMMRYKPQVLYANTSHLDLMALELKKRNLNPQFLKLLLGSGDVIQEKNKALYKKHFNTDITESYGSVEMGVMAFETMEKRGMKLNEDLTYFEFLDDNDRPVPPDTLGRVVVTDLNNKLMPFIRYDQGDYAIYNYVKNNKGEMEKRITKIIGRDDDYAVLPDGSRRPYHDFYVIMSKFENIYQFRVIQKQKAFFEILVSTSVAYFDQIHDTLMINLKEKFPPQIAFNIIRVEEIKPDKTGKIRVLISEVK